jgi:nucleotidyltransferase substrate binding protein (TIGR01987 family)
MEKVNEKISDFLKALKTLENILKKFYESRTLYRAHPIDKNQESFFIVRDATIQRFEYCTDLIWKVLKIYLEDVEKMHIEAFYPRAIIRTTVTGGLVSESEGKDLINMVESRNKTSHIYHEAIAEDIANKIPQYYVLMQTIVDRMCKQLS